jgi:cell division protein FtsB
MVKKMKIVGCALMLSLLMFGCSTEKQKNQAKEAAARYWQDKAYPGKAYDVQVIEAEKVDDGWRVKGIVDGETRTGVFNPETETFSEGYYSLAKERDKHIAELEQEVKYYKERSENYEKEIYKLKVRLSLATGKTLDSDSQDEDDVTKVAAPAAGTPAAPAAPKTESQ